MPVTMMLANDRLRVSLVTTHVPLSQAASAVTEGAIRGAFTRTLAHLAGLGIRKPRIGICGINPHVGEAGLLGPEDEKVTKPVAAALAREYEGRAVIDGPLASDTLFAVNDGQPKGKRYDAVLAMYHDQGLIPVKLLDFARTVNITLGLPFVRTSVDHGVAFDLVGKNLADPSSLKAAVVLAAKLAGTKKEKSP
jgi:4-hydroxythreonine-4-phosphate dehydrogenase